MSLLGDIGDIWGDVTSFFSGLFGGDPNAPDFLAMGIAETGVTPPGPQLGLVDPGVGMPSLDFGALTTPEEEEEDDPLKEEKKVAALAARALQVQEQGRTGRSSTFLTRGMTLGAAPARRSFLTRGL